MKRKSKLWLLAFAAPALTVAFSAAAAKMMLAGVLPESALPTAAPIIAGLVALILGIWCAVRAPQKKLLWSMAGTACYGCALMLGNLLFFGVGYADVAKILGAVFGCGLFGGVIGSAKRQKRKNRF